MRRKILFIILAVLAMVLAVVFVSQKLAQPETTPTVVRQPVAAISDETAGWKTYKNEKMEFTIEYPDSQGIKPFDKYTNDNVVELRPQYAWETPVGDGGWEPTMLEIRQQEYKAGPLDDYLLNLWNNVLNFQAYNQGKLLDKSYLLPIEISGITGYSLRVSSIEDSWTENYIIYNNNLYRLSCLYGDKNFMDLCKQMLSTFKFIK